MCLVREAETEKGITQIRLRQSVGVSSGVMDKRAVGGRIISSERLFQMRSRRGEPAGEHQVYAGGHVTQDEARRVVPFAALTQKVLVQALGQIQFSAVGVITRLSVGDLNELRGASQPFPQLARAGISAPCFGSPLTFDGSQRALSEL